MSSDHHSREEELRLREEAIRERELQIRMRELEAELDPTPLHPTTKHETTSKKGRLWYERIPNIAKFVLLLVVVIVAIRIAAWLATAALVLGIAWVGYKFFLEGDHD